MTLADRTYQVSFARVTPELKGYWDGPAWRAVAPLNIDQFHARSTDHHPRTQAKMVYGRDGAYVIYRVEDKYVRAIHTKFNDMVAMYSCVEFFVLPKPGHGFFNFEFSCGGTLLCFYTRKWREEGGPNDYVPLTDEQLSMVKVYHSMPQVVDPEIAEPREWTLEFFLPYALLEQFVGPLGEPAGQQWRGNFYKCVHAEDAHPHWAAWSPVEILNFHQPRCFGTLSFAPSEGQAGCGCGASRGRCATA
ncbi:MAG: carbohydrate-binding family 9-like protein [Phycisphaeraceae bacterium]|nr:carbohydrate-binding family 9-like protein [Phycisphaeraceae bacterium]